MSDTKAQEPKQDGGWKPCAVVKHEVQVDHNPNLSLPEKAACMNAQQRTQIPLEQHEVRTKESFICKATAGLVGCKQETRAKVSSQGIDRP